MLVSSSRAIVSNLLAGGRSLPPDWAAISTAGQTVAGTSSSLPAADPIGDPGNPASTAVSPASSFDAVRVAIRFATKCVPADRRLAASLWPLYGKAPGRDSYALDGTPRTTATDAVSFVAAAAAARAAGARAASTRLLDQAQAVEAAHPSYYGAAWVALGRAMLTTAALGGCSS
jgi:hypothetical protein